MGRKEGKRGKKRGVGDKNVGLHMLYSSLFAVRFV